MGHNGIPLDATEFAADPDNPARTASVSTRLGVRCIGMREVPSDEIATHAAVKAMAAIDTPAYLRAGRPNVPIIYPNGCHFQLGKAITVREGTNLTIIANGLMVAAAL